MKKNWQEASSQRTDSQKIVLQKTVKQRHSALLLILVILAPFTSYSFQASDRTIDKCISTFETFADGSEMVVKGDNCAAKFENEGTGGAFQLRTITADFEPQDYYWEASKQALVLEKDWQYKDSYDVKFCKISGKKFEAKWKYKQASGWRRAFTVTLTATKNDQGEVETLKMQVRRHADLFLGDAGMLHAEQSCKMIQ